MKSNGRPAISCCIRRNEEEIYFDSLKDMAIYFNNIEDKDRDDKQLRALAYYIANSARKGMKYKEYEIEIFE